VCQNFIKHIVHGCLLHVCVNDILIHLFFCSHRQAQAAVLEGLKRLHSLKVPTRRPNDYFAEMAKSDVHMKRVNCETAMFSLCIFSCTASLLNV